MKELTIPEQKTITVDQLYVELSETDLAEALGDYLSKRNYELPSNLKIFYCCPDCLINNRLVGLKIPVEKKFEKLFTD